MRAIALSTLPKALATAGAAATRLSRAGAAQCASLTAAPGGGRAPLDHRLRLVRLPPHAPASIAKRRPERLSQRAALARVTDRAQRGSSRLRATPPSRCDEITRR